MRAVTLAKDGGEDEVVGKYLGIGFLLFELLPRLGEAVVRRHVFFLPAIGATGGFFTFGAEGSQGRGRVLHVDTTILGGFEVLKRGRDGFADGGEGGGAKGTVSAIVEVDALAHGVHEEADHDAPVEEWTGYDSRVGHAARGDLLLQGLGDLDFGLKDR